MPRSGDRTSAVAKPKVLEGQAVDKIGLQGVGGIGKSVLAAALARDREVCQAFPDGIYWLTIGQAPKLPTSQTCKASLCVS